MCKNQPELNLGKNLRYLIRESGMTVVALSKKTGVPLQTLHGWLCGNSPRNIMQVKVVAGYFGLAIDEICFSDNLIENFCYIYLKHFRK